jgi:ABC-type sugar transport system permease subunit
VSFLFTLEYTVLITPVLIVGGYLLALLTAPKTKTRAVTRTIIFVPVVIGLSVSSLLWYWLFSTNFGVINRVLLDLGVLDKPVNWLAHPNQALLWMMGVAVFVTLPFTSFVILAGLQSIPDDVYEAARVDGASAWTTYFRITLPLLRPSLLIGTIVNVINVFNNFPIIWSMTQGGPGHATDITTTFTYKIAFFDKHVGESAAMAVVNFLLILLMVLLYLRAVRRPGARA